MQVLNSSWQQAGDATPTKLTVQNVGDVRIAYVFAATQPGISDIILDSDEHGVFQPGSVPFTISDLSTEGKSMFVRALGPKNGKLFIA